MKKYFITTMTCLMFCFSGCNSFLEVEPLEKVSAEELLQYEPGLKMLLASLYRHIPMEDFAYNVNRGFNQHDITAQGGDVASLQLSSFTTDESSRSDGFWGWGFDYWYVTRDNRTFSAYMDIRDVNLFMTNIELSRKNNIITEASYNHLKSEAHFIRAYIYFGLAKRYGGVPLIDKVLDEDYVPGSDNEALYIPRSTEADTWKFILKECDLAITNLPPTVSEGTLRATKWAAYGLKSRAALHAASIAKYWDKAPLSGEAVTQKFVGGMTAADATFFYGECLSASKAIIDNTSGIELYKPAPTSREEAAVNYQYLFLTKNSELIFTKAYVDGMLNPGNGHMWDLGFSPMQNNPGYVKVTRFSPTLDLVDIYEDYTDDGQGKSAKIVTRTDGVEDYTYANPAQLDVNLPFKKYKELNEPFKGKDARLSASIIVPGATYKGTKIIMQAGLIRKNGQVVVYDQTNEVGKDGKTYYSFGGQNLTDFSGFCYIGNLQEGNYSGTGFTIRKYLGEDRTIVGRPYTDTKSFIDMRLAEFYLNYAEAAVESGTGDMALAANLINALRKRAGHTDKIPATLENILRERKVELAFEGLRFWDMVRRRDFHIFFNTGRRHALLPIIDLREDDPKYIFVRANFFPDETAGGRTFQPYRYYWSIPGVNTNKLTQNPGY